MNWVNIINILALVCWTIAGTLVLTGRKVTKPEYALCWVLLLFHLTIDVITNWR